MKELKLHTYCDIIKASRDSGVLICLQRTIVDQASVSLDKIMAKVDYGFLWNKMNTNRHKINKKKILERDQYVCAYCYGAASVVEHVVPWDWSKNDDENNLVASCVECNQIATDKIFSSFDEKLAYILVIRTGRKWTRKLAIKYQVFRCTTCKKVFTPLQDGATNFLCPECTREEYKDD